MSEYGEIDDIHLIRDEETGKSRGFAFIKYEDSRSCTLAVDNLCGASVLGRSIRVDHVEKYRLPKKLQEQEAAEQQDNDDVNRFRSNKTDGDGKDLNDDKYSAGHAYKGMDFENKYSIHKGIDLFAPQPPPPLSLISAQQSCSNNSNDNRSSYEEKLRRKEERAKKRREKEERKRVRNKKRERKEEKKRRKLAKDSKLERN